MVDKPRKPGRPTGPKAGSERSARPGNRPQNQGRSAGKPERGPARPRKVAGVDLSALDRLEQEGLLSEEGRRLRKQALGGATGVRPPRFPRTERPAADRPHRAERPHAERPHAERPQRPERPAQERPFRPGRQRDGFGDGFGGFASVDEQLAQSVARGPRPAGRRPRPEGEAEQPRRYGGAGPYERQKRQPLPGPTPRGPRKLNPAESAVAERLHKVMARAGVASRRHSEELIQAGRVTVNGRVVTELGIKVVAGKDLIEVDGRPLGRPESLIYLLLNKPKGYVTTLYDPQGRPKVTDLLGAEVAERVYPIGRLDYETEGLLVLTNDGDLANGLMHPARQVKKTYIAKVRGVPGPAKLRALETGIELEDGVTAPADVKMLEVKAPNSATVSLRIHEGRNRQVRRMFEAIGHEVIHLKRTTLGPLHLKELPVGQWRPLTEQEVQELYRAAGLRFGAKGGPRRTAKPRA